jgi:hypothetical protein
MQVIGRRVLMLCQIPWQMCRLLLLLLGCVVLLMLVLVAVLLCQEEVG